MKLNILITFSVVLFAAETLAQPPASKPLTPARGHYRQLAKYSPLGIDPELDGVKFETDIATIDRRMSLKPYYLTDVTLADFDIPDVPANSSDRTRAEINYLLELQKHRTDEDIRASLYFANIWYNPRISPEDSSYHRLRKNLFHIGRSIGTWFNEDTLPLTAELMARVWRDASYFIWSMKFKYARIRPYVIDRNLKNLQETNWAAYPSGHAANSYVNAYIYQELAPEFADVFLKDAYDMAHSREIIGVHYPSDSEVSRVFARQFVNMLFSNEKFQEEFKAVQAEWATKAIEKL